MLVVDEVRHGNLLLVMAARKYPEHDVKLLIYPPLAQW